LATRLRILLVQAGNIDKTTQGQKGLVVVHGRGPEQDPGRSEESRGRLCFLWEEWCLNPDSGRGLQCHMLVGL